MAVCNLTVGNVELSNKEEDREEEEELTSADLALTRCVYVPQTSLKMSKPAAEYYTLCVKA